MHSTLSKLDLDRSVECSALPSKRREVSLEYFLDQPNLPLCPPYLFSRLPGDELLTPAFMKSKARRSSFTMSTTFETCFHAHLLYSEFKSTCPEPVKKCLPEHSQCARLQRDRTNLLIGARRCPRTQEGRWATKMVTEAPSYSAPSSALFLI